MRRRPQLDLRFHRRGGKRPGAGRKPNGEKAGVSHLQRPRFARTVPVHVTMRAAPHVWNLRSQRAFRVVGPAIAKAAERFGMRIVQFSVQGNHLHLIVEAADTRALSRAMQGFSVRVARGLNRMMKRRGRVLGDRFHAHVLRTPSETRRAVAYVRSNYRKHLAELGQRVSTRVIDEYSSAASRIDLASPSTWLLKQSVGPPA